MSVSDFGKYEEFQKNLRAQDSDQLLATSTSDSVQDSVNAKWILSLRELFEGDEKPGTLDGNVISQHIGFIEGQLRTNLPYWLIQKCAVAEIENGGYIKFAPESTFPDPIQVGELLTFQKELIFNPDTKRYGIYSNDSIGVAESTLKLILSKVRSDSNSSYCSIAVSSTQVAIVVYYEDSPDGDFQLSVFDKQGREQWSQRVWAFRNTRQGMRSATERWVRLDITIAKDMFVISGRDASCFFVEAFLLSSGQPKMRFNSAFYGCGI